MLGLRSTYTRNLLESRQHVLQRDKRIIFGPKRRIVCTKIRSTNSGAKAAQETT